MLYAFDQNPAGSDKGNEWVALYNPSNESVNIGNWILETADGERETIPEGTILYPFAYYLYSPLYQWLDNSDEAITLSGSKGEEVDKSPVVSDNENDTPPTPLPQHRKINCTLQNALVEKAAWWAAMCYAGLVPKSLDSKLFLLIAPLSIFFFKKIRNSTSRREIILALFTVVPKVSPVLWFHNFILTYWW